MDAADQDPDPISDLIKMDLRDQKNSTGLTLLNPKNIKQILLSQLQ